MSDAVKRTSVFPSGIRIHSGRVETGCTDAGYVDTAQHSSSEPLGSVRVALDVPRIQRLDEAICTFVDRAHGEFVGASLLQLEPTCSFALTSELWADHVARVRRHPRLSLRSWLQHRHGHHLRVTLQARVEGDSLVLDIASHGQAASLLDTVPTMLDEIPAAMCEVSPSGRVVACNAFAAPFLEVRFNEASGRYEEHLPSRVFDLQGDVLPAGQAPWSVPLGSDLSPARSRLGFLRANGTTQWVQVKVGRSRRHPDYRWVTMADVTAEKQTQDALRLKVTSVSSLEDQLARSEHMASLGLMAAGVAHEINNPLSYILSNLSFAAERAIDHESREALREALEGAGRVRDIVRDLRTLSRMETDEDLHAVDVRNAVDAALKLALQETRPRARVQRHFQEVPPVLGEETRLVQVLLNLIINAAHAIPPGAPGKNQIMVEVKSTGCDEDVSAEEVLLRISDTGTGIAPEHLSKVFEPFFTTKPVGAGTGLGLSICHRLIYGMGGRIEVESRVGEGTTFSIFLCAATRFETDSHPRSEIGSAQRKPHVLIVEDEPAVARGVARLLNKECHIDMAMNAAQARSLIGANDYDAILCDMVMPDETGIQLYRSVRAEQPEMADRFVFATGGLFNQELSDGVRLLSNAIVEKPYEPQDLRRCLAQVIEKTRARRTEVAVRASRDLSE